MSSRVHIIVGSPSELLARLQEQAIGAESPFWLVPNDFHAPRFENSLTFPQLALKLAAPPVNQPLLSEPQQRMLMREVMATLVSQRKLKVLGKLLDTPSGASLVFAFISELKDLGVEPDQWDELAAEAAGRRPLERDVSLIFHGFQKLLKEHALLDRDAVVRLALGRTKWPAIGDAVFVHGFAGWTPPQLSLLQRLATQVGKLCLSLPAEADTSERFTSVTSTQVFQAFPSANVEEPSAPAHLPRDREKRDGLPVGLAHLSRNLFVDNAPLSADGDGLVVLEAPGMIGEVRMVARAIKSQINSGVAPESIVVAIRQMSSYAGLMDETFADYDIPFALDATLPLSLVPVVAGLFKAAAIARHGFQFSDISDMLRNTLFRPDCPELTADPELPLAADLLLRQLNEPRGREAMLDAAARWAAAPPVPLEDEDAEQSHQARIHELAKRCLPFLTKYFALWDSAPKLADFDHHVAWLAAFANSLGWPDDDPALQQLHADLAGWSDRERQIAPKKIWPHEQFLDRLGELAALATRPRSPASVGQVQVLAAGSAAGLQYDHLYLLGMGERGFPDLSVAARLYDDSDRAAFRGVGLDVDVAAERFPAEKLLFLRLVLGVRRSLTLSYPATDEKGQELLPGSFLRAIRDDLFGVGPDGKSVIKHVRKTMLTDGLDEDEPLSIAEKRIRHARAKAGGAVATPELAAHLIAVRGMGNQRFRKGNFSAFDGMLTDANVRQQIAQRFGTDRAMSPTALEAYIACPFKFFAGRVLKLVKWADPSEEIEAHRRGSAYHRALTRLHRGQQRRGQVADRLSAELAFAIGEYADRAGSRTTKILWQLELERLQRSANNYANQLAAHNEAWSDFGKTRTELLEEPYAIVVEVGSQRMKLGGRMDRIDVIETDAGAIGFLVIDYKTGRSGSYTRPAVQKMSSLQLAVYSLAAERRLGELPPLGMLYWMPLDQGPKVALAGDKLNWPVFRGRLEAWLLELAGHIRAGEFPLQPRDDNACRYCDFHRMCRIAQGGPAKSWTLPLPVVESDVDE